jgi:hypothetical protein
MALMDVKNGQTCLFYQGTWGNVNLRVNSPELFSFAKNKFISVAKAWNQNSPNQLLHLPSSDIAYDQFQDLSLIRTTDRQLTQNKDNWTYSWSWG